MLPREQAAVAGALEDLSVLLVKVSRYHDLRAKSKQRNLPLQKPPTLRYGSPEARSVLALQGGSEANPAIILRWLLVIAEEYRASLRAVCRIFGVSTRISNA